MHIIYSLTILVYLVYIIDSTLIQELISILAKSQALKASYFNILLHSNLKLLDLSLCSHLVSDQLLKIVTIRCKVTTNPRGDSLPPKVRGVRCTLYGLKSVVWYLLGCQKSKRTTNRVRQYLLGCSLPVIK